MHSPAHINRQVPHIAAVRANGELNEWQKCVLYASYTYNQMVNASF